MKAASDLTNELLKSNAENLRSAQPQVREQMERGVFDIETVREANEQLVATSTRASDRRRGQAAPGRGRGRARDMRGRAAASTLAAASARGRTGPNRP